MRLRLLLTRACNRDCAGCCNKEWDLDAVKVVERYDQYDLIMLTGGEPALFPELVYQTVRKIRQQTGAPIIMYTAAPKQAFDIMGILDGLTLTLHDQTDVYPFRQMNSRLGMWNHKREHMRLNIFRSVDIGRTDTSRWMVSANRVWDADCPLPEGEEFRRLEDA